jgi:hypothetical protein
MCRVVVREWIASPDGAGELGGVVGYKDLAPDGAAPRSSRDAFPLNETARRKSDRLQTLLCGADRVV